MNEVDIQNYSQLDIPSDLAEPAVELDSNVIEIGDVPEITEAPRVIGGVIQEQ